MKLLPCAALCAALFAYANASADELIGSRNELWLVTGFATHHFEDDRNLNGKNPGIGMELRMSDSFSATAGRFYNSDRRHSRYVGVLYQPWSYKRVRFGMVAAGFDGYPRMRDGRWFAALIPAASYEYKRVGVNVAFVPSYKDRLYGGLSVQLKYRIWQQ